MLRRPPGSTSSSTVLPSRTLFRSSLAMARLQAIAPGLRRVGLSAPIADPAQYAAWLAPDSRGILRRIRSQEHTSEHPSLMRLSYAVYCLKKKLRIRQDVFAAEDDDTRITNRITDTTRICNKT